MASWVITDTITSKRVETFDVATMQLAKTLPRYEVEPILEYLYRINEEIKKGNHDV